MESNNKGSKDFSERVSRQVIPPSPLEVAEEAPLYQCADCKQLMEKTPSGKCLACDGVLSKYTAPQEPTTQKEGAEQEEETGSWLASTPMQGNTPSGFAAPSHSIVSIEGEKEFTNEPGQS